LNRDWTRVPEWKQYTASLLIFNTVLFVFSYAVCCAAWMPLNQLGRECCRPRRFQQCYVVYHQYESSALSGDQHFSNLAKSSSALRTFSYRPPWVERILAIIRALRGDSHVGNYFVDMWRTVVYVFLPVAFVLSFICSATGQSDDIRLCAPGRNAGTRVSGNWRRRAAETTNACRRTGGDIRASKDAGHERRRIYGMNSAHRMRIRPQSPTSLLRLR